MNFFRILAAAVPLMIGSLQAQAALISFNFENEPIVETTPFTIISAGVSASFAGRSAADPGAFEISFNSSSGPFGAPYRGLSGAFLTTALASIDPASPLTISFSAPVTSISLNFGLGDRSGTLSLLTGAGGTAQTVGAVPVGFSYAEGTLSYSGAAFRTLTLSTAANGIALDNIVVDTAAAAVPEPATAALLGTGLLGLLALRRQARR